MVIPYIPVTRHVHHIITLILISYLWCGNRQPAADDYMNVIR